jgi:MFS family permease
MVAMNLIYAASAYPFGKLSDRMSHTKLLALGLVVLILADVVALAGLAWQVTRAGGGVDTKHHPGGARDCVDNIVYGCLISPARKLP